MSYLKGLNGVSRAAVYLIVICVCTTFAVFYVLAYLLLTSTKKLNKHGIYYQKRAGTNKILYFFSEKLNLPPTSEIVQMTPIDKKFVDSHLLQF